MTTPEQDTYGCLLAALRPGLLRFARIQLRDPAQAEDIVQETLAAAWGKLGQFREEADLKTWVTAILKNKIADHFRSGRRTVVSLDSLREENEAADQAWHSCFDAAGHWLETAAPAAWALVDIWLNLRHDAHSSYAPKVHEISAFEQQK